MTGLGDRARRLFVAGSLGLSSLLSGCISIQEGNERISVVASPFGASVSEETLEGGKVISRQDTSVTMFMGNVHMDVRNYENGKFVGRYKIKMDGVLGNYNLDNVVTEHYNEKGKLIKTEKGTPSDLGPSARSRLRGF